ncbi:hypothetical protein HC028_18680 [Planosporangium flavigriseum]|uniref:hypothetical protein n=1 Tax=Planosporangium flavigriseum TaxID=373681 RepID=UPI00143B90D9|nr:hypothetical protein [Planosporangium flavigriseum]NJC66515.1 hypothetical protein [Planosporangium flavigriseum]
MVAEEASADVVCRTVVATLVELMRSVSELPGLDAVSPAVVITLKRVAVAPDAPSAPRFLAPLLMQRFDPACSPELYLYPRVLKMDFEVVEEHRYPIALAEITADGSVHVAAYERYWRFESEIKKGEEYHAAAYLECYSSPLIRY